jgi:hypothetical protein
LAPRKFVGDVELSPVKGLTALQFAKTAGHAGIVTLIQNRNKKQETPLLFKRVVINGLVAKPELNGRTGTVISFDVDKGRYSVELSDCFVMIKPCNLLPTTVCGGLYVAKSYAYTAKALLTYLFCRRQALRRPKSSRRKMLTGR